MGIFSSRKIIEEKFDLKRAILKDEVDLIFGESDELIEEISRIKGKDGMKIIIRNFMEDRNASHWFSMKFIPSRKIDYDIHNGEKGIPIVFEKLSKKYI